ncbi:fungal-specific transcription factor domain-containing protein [Trichoderma asperelloides]|nr:fungal-specific transcription factor domain-containing protein [Trichoderma asperelloides]
MSDSVMVAPPRKPTGRGSRRGRKPTSCTQCHLRKQKCDRNQPCNRCLQRGVAHLCGDSTNNGVFKISESPQVVTIAPPSPSPRPRRVTQPPMSPSLGSLFANRGARAFYGSSYFGHQVASRILSEEGQDLPAGISRGRDTLQSFRDESSSFAQVWDLLGLLPRQKSTVDRLVDIFLTEVNWSLDAVHEATFRSSYDEFWGRRFGFDDLANVDLRWLGLLFIILAFGVLLDSPPHPTLDVQREREEASLRFYWAARRAIVIAPSFYGESTDIVRAGLLVTRYLLYTRRVSESWLTIGFASRMAQAQGMHVDGERWRMTRKATEQRRRLWSHIYAIDRMISLALGRPYAINNQFCLTQEPENVWLDDMEDEEASRAVPQPLSLPTPSVLSSLLYRLAQVVGKIQEKCFGMERASYEAVLQLDANLVRWSEQLPPYFRLDNPDTAADDALPFLPWHRLYLHTSFHFARIVLHRPFLLRESITDRFRTSHEACMSSALADLKIRLRTMNSTNADSLRWAFGAHNLFNSAMILGIIAVKNPHSVQAGAIIEDLEAYCENLHQDPWLNEFGMAELKVVELCISKAKDSRYTSMAAYPSGTPPEPPGARIQTVDGSGRMRPSDLESPAMSSDMSSIYWPTVWEDGQFTFPGAADFSSWEQMITGIAEDNYGGQ